MCMCEELYFSAFINTNGWKHQEMMKAISVCKYNIYILTESFKVTNISKFLVS